MTVLVIAYSTIETLKVCVGMHPFAVNVFILYVDCHEHVEHMSGIIDKTF